MKLHYSIQGVSVRVRSDNVRFLAYCRRFLALIERSGDGNQIELEVTVPKGGFNRVGDLICQKLWGSGARQTADSFTFCAHQGAGIYCEISEGETGMPQQIVCHPEISPARRLLRLFRGRQTTDNQTFMTIIRQGILLPVLARLLAKQRMLTLHASVVALNRRAIVLTGLNGCGKSGLALHLVAQHQFSFLSDNYAVINPATGMAHAFPEPIRVGDGERAQAQGFFTGEDHAFGKWQLSPLPQTLCPEAPVGCLARIHIGERFAVREVEGNAFADHLDSFHRFLGETPEYAWLQIYYQMRHGIHLGQVADVARKKLCASVPCCEMEIPRAATSEERYQEATQWISKELAKTR